MDGLFEGRIVHYVMPNGDHRPAIVVRVWRGPCGEESGCSNLQVFTDGRNDGPGFESGVHWATSVAYSDEPKPGTWHWPERRQANP
jgi:hypothetical protein